MADVNEQVKSLKSENDFLYWFLNRYFEPPCQYEYDNIPDVCDFIDKTDDGDSWCEQNCKNSDYKGCEECWKRFIGLLRECGKELNEYGKEQDGRES